MTATIQRPLRGSRISSFYPIKSLPSLASLDSAFQLQEYISLLIRLDVHDVNSIVSLPGNLSAKDKEKEVEGSFEREGTEGEKDADIVDKGKAEPTVDEACWIYEQLRRLAQDLSHPLITTLQQECTRASCPEMKAGEWLYLCVAHGNDGAMEHCCAIDYILHTLDSATALLNSPRTFPSRLQIPVASHRHFSSLARRLGRIFAHAYFHHREAFEQAEAESSLYARFLALTERFDLVPAEFLVIPTDSHNTESVGESLGLGPPSILTRDEHRRHEFDRGYHLEHQQQQLLEQGQRILYELDLAQDHHGPQHQLHLDLPERNPSPPGPSSYESRSSLGGIGESPSPSARARFGRHRTGTMVFAEAEANAVTNELARSSFREREREPRKIELLERDGEHMPVISTAPTNEEEDVQFEISLSPEIGKSIEEDRIVELGREVTPSSSTSDIVVDQELEDPAASVEPATSTQVKFDDGFQTQPIPIETTTNNSLTDVNVSIPVTASILKETPETAIPSHEVATKPNEKEIDDDATDVPIVLETLISVEPKVETTPEPGEREPRKIELLERDGEQHMPVISTAPANEVTASILKETPETVIPSHEVATKPDEKEINDDATDVPVALELISVEPKVETTPEPEKIEPTNVDETHKLSRVILG